MYESEILLYVPGGDYTVVLSCGLSRQNSDLGTSLLNELLQVDLPKLLCQLLQRLLLLL